MLFNRPATKSGPLFDLLQECFEKDTVPDELALAKMRRDADQVLQTQDRSKAHILRSGIAALEWRLDEALQHVELAVKEDRSAVTLINAVVTLDFLNRPDLALPYARAAAGMAPYEEDVINAASGLLIAVGNVTEAAELQAQCLHSVPKADFDFDAVMLLEGMAEASVSEAWLSSELSLAREVLIEAKLRTRNFSVNPESDPDGSMSVEIGFGFLGDLNDELTLDDRLALRLAETEQWNPNKLSVHFNYIEADAVNAN